MKTKLNPCHGRQYLCRLFLLILTLISCHTKAQIPNGIETLSLATAGGRNVIHNAWTIRNNPSVWPTNKNTLGLCWTQISSGTAINFSSLAYRRRSKLWSMGMQWNRLGYKVSSFNAVYMGLQRKWTTEVVTGLTMKYSSRHILGYQNSHKTINAMVGIGVKQKNGMWTLVIDDFLPASNVISGNSMYMSLSYCRSVSSEIQVLIENSLHLDGRFSPKITAIGRLNERLDIYLGISHAPDKISFGCSYSHGNGSRITSATSFQSRFGWQPSTSLELLK